MGYHIFSFGIKADSIQAVFGSKDSTLLEKVRKSWKYASYTGDYPGLPKALEDIIAGNPVSNTTQDACLYALICICDVLRVKIPYYHEIKLGFETDLMDECLLELGISRLEIATELLRERTAFGLPAPVDYPRQGLIRHPGLLDLRERLKDAVITPAEITAMQEIDFVKGIVYQHLKGIIENISYCADHQLDLISFCH